MKIKIEVRQEHIDSGLKYDSQGCAIANAVRDIFPDANVGRCMMFLCFDLDSNVRLPESARNFIRSFDNPTQKSEPFNFEIDLSDRVIDALCMPDLIDLLNQVDNMQLVEA